MRKLAGATHLRVTLTISIGLVEARDGRTVAYVDQARSRVEAHGGSWADEQGMTTIVQQEGRAMLDRVARRCNLGK